MVAVVALVVIAIVFALGHLLYNDRMVNASEKEDMGTEIVETISVEEMIAAKEETIKLVEAAVSATSEASENAVATESSDEASIDESVTEETVEVSTEATTEVSTGAAVLPNEDLAKFMAEYPDTVAWLSFEDDRLSYPIMQAGDNSKYAIKDYEGNDSETGSLFLDYRATSDFSDANSIIYGHNMRNRTMFGALRTYKEDLGFLENHKYFQIITPEGTRRYMLFAFMDVPKNSYIYDVCGANPENMREFLDTIEYKTYIDTGIEPTVDDKIITLSTCTKSDTLFFVMFAVEVE
ncbi:MAG: sortase [Butyrivibrio sp.]|uniref:sortase domain-containing protein n=1 Tax=Butyrivibrio sp. TaxID=28121 RepID=UPI0025BDA387|nr:sortase [Butyrivibrio sp.]MBQ6588831.1 sortase [Butyrivibrio sp.]